MATSQSDKYFCPLAVNYFVPVGKSFLQILKKISSRMMRIVMQVGRQGGCSSFYWESQKDVSLNIKCLKGILSLKVVSKGCFLHNSVIIRYQYFILDGVYDLLFVSPCLQSKLIWECFPSHLGFYFNWYSEIWIGGEVWQLRGRDMN